MHWDPEYFKMNELHGAWGSIGHCHLLSMLLGYLPAYQQDQVSARQRRIAKDSGDSSQEGIVVARTNQTKVSYGQTRSELQERAQLEDPHSKHGKPGITYFGIVRRSDRDERLVKNDKRWARTTPSLREASMSGKMRRDERVFLAV